LKEPGKSIRPFKTVFVELKLHNKQGKIEQRTVGYQGTLQPLIAVLLEES